MTIDWRMSAALEDVPRGGNDLPEVTSLAGAVHAWWQLDAEHQARAVLTTDHPVQVDDDGAAVQSFTGGAIRALVDRLRQERDGAG